MQFSPLGKLIKELLALGLPRDGYIAVELAVDDWMVELYIPRAELTPLEESKYVHLGGKYKARVDPPHVPSGMKHLHGYAGKKQIFAMNIDGSGHDGSSGYRIPNKIADGIRQRFPEFRVPDSNIIEWVDPAQRRLLFG